MRCRAIFCLFGLLLAVAGCAHEHNLTAQPRLDLPPPPALPALPAVPYHLHLNGIGGYRSIDQYMLTGLQEGGLDGEVIAYDWTGADVGLSALLATGRHRSESHHVAQMFLDAARQQPGRRITLSTHSAGAGIALWALAELPEDVKVDSIVMLAPALSPSADLTPLLRHVSGKVYSFYSPYDVAVLGVGTKMMGTVDGVRTEAAGKVGFSRPPSADPTQYAKLVQVPYDSAWLKLGNIGDHIGPMSRPFAREVTAPLLLTGKLAIIRNESERGAPAAPIKLPPPMPTSTTTPASPTTTPTTAPASPAATTTAP